MEIQSEHLTQEIIQVQGFQVAVLPQGIAVVHPLVAVALHQ
jgi:hypothetical protein